MVQNTLDEEILQMFSYERFSRIRKKQDSCKVIFTLKLHWIK